MDFFLSITIEFLGQNTVGNYRKTCGFVPTKLAVTQKACERERERERERLREREREKERYLSS